MIDVSGKNAVVTGGSRRRSSSAKADRVALWILAAVTIVAVSLGIWLRLSLVGSGSLWLDELWTLDAVSRSFKEMIGARLVSDQSPPLFTVLTWLWLQVTGTYDASAMRLLSIGLGSLAIFAPIVGASRLRSMRPALLVMAALAALSLFPLQYAIELRAYSMMIGLSTVSTVVWVGLLTGDLPRSGRWIFVFALTGALAGFAHYYGNLPYVAELALLAGSWVRAKPRRPLYTLLGWGSLSLMPVFAWFVLTQRWFRNQAVAPPPSVAEISTWVEYAFSPVTTVFRQQPPGYADGSGGSGVLFMLAAALIIAAAALLGRNRHVWSLDGRRSVQVGTYALLALAMGLAVAWVASVVRPPSMNVRNLAALLPLLFLAVGCAATPARSERANRLTGGAVIAVWVMAAMALIVQFGVAALTPPWQAQGGYRATVQALLASTHETPPPALIGLELPWDWHGHWDAAVNAELGRPHMEPSDPAPLNVRWILDVQELRLSGLPASPLIVFTDADDQRSLDLFAWLEEARSGCQTTLLGGPGFGVVSLLRCPGSG